MDRDSTTTTWHGVIVRFAIVSALVFLNLGIWSSDGAAQGDKKGVCTTCAGPPSYKCCPILICYPDCTCGADGDCDDELPGT